MGQILFLRQYDIVLLEQFQAGKVSIERHLFQNQCNQIMKGEFHQHIPF